MGARFRVLVFLIGVLIGSGLATAQQSVRVRVIDVGAGLCSVASITGPEGTAYLVFDAGAEFPFQAHPCLEGVQEVVGGSPVDVMVISHSDADHLADADDVLDAFQVKRIVRTGASRSGPGQWKRFDDAVAREVEEGAEDRNLANDPLRPGEEISLAGATLTFVAGWSEWLAPERFDQGEERNVISIVARLHYDGRSVLFTGDTIGRRKTDEDGACKNAEEFMVANSGNVPIRSNVLIAPHHGGNNGSSACFIAAVFGGPGERVVPRYVVFPSGHAHGHPTQAVIDRLREHGGLGDRYMLRTDRGDDELSRYHADADPPGCHDPVGDDSVDISWAQGSRLQVKYIGRDGACVQGQ